MIKDDYPELLRCPHCGQPCYQEQQLKMHVLIWHTPAKGVSTDDTRKTGCREDIRTTHYYPYGLKKSARLGAR